VPTAVILSESHLAHELGYVQDWLSENLLISMGSLSSVVAGNNYVALGGHVTRQVGPWVRWHEDFITDAPDAIMIFTKATPGVCSPTLNSLPKPWSTWRSQSVFANLITRHLSHPLPCWIT